MATSRTCLYPKRHLATGRFCQSLASWVVIGGVAHVLCAHHIGVMRKRKEVS